LHRNDERYLFVSWEDNVEGEFQVNLRVVVFNGRGVLAALTNVISDSEGNIVDIQVLRDDGYTNTLIFRVGVKSRIHLARIIRRIRLNKAVNKIERFSINEEGDENDS
jgi:(p)ppGpp synthase/HD superfamily hydrolase